MINAKVINEKDSRMYKFVKVDFVRTVFVEVLSVVSIIPLHITTESPIIYPTYLPHSQLHVAGFQI